MITKKLAAPGVAALLTPILFLVPAAVSAQPADAASSTGSRAAAIARVRPALVRLSVVFSEFEGGREVRREASGSGFIITPEGHVVTNHHVAGGATRVQATMPDGKRIEARVVGADAMSDLAVVKLEAPAGTVFPTVAFGDSSRLALGEPVLAMGSPLGLSQSITSGVVSNLALVMPAELEIEGEDVGTLVRWIGHDAPIFPGNSGGPLVNLRGEVIGVNEIGFGLGGAIPGNLAREVAESLVRDGRVRRAWLGLELQPLLTATGREEGALVSGCVEGSPAAEAGVVAGDILLRIGTADILARTAEDLAPLNQLVAALPIGTPVELRVRRDGREHRLRATPLQREARRARVEEVAALGFTGSNLTSSHARELHRESPRGVFVDSVRPGGSLDAARPRLVAGDLIVAIDGEDVADLAGLRARLEAGTAAAKNGASKNAAKNGAAPAMLVAFERGQDRFLTLVRPGARDTADRSTEAARAWLPVNTQPLPPALGERLGMPGLQGLLVTRVFPESSAEQAGLRAGDVLLDFDGEALGSARADEPDPLPSLARRRRIGATVPVTVWRDGAKTVLQVALAPAPPTARDAARHRDEWLDFSARELVPYDEERTGGVKVDEVVEGGWAALARLRVGDVILSVDGTKTPDLAAFEEAMAMVARARPAHVVLLVRRGESTRFIEVRPIWPAAPR